MLSYLGDIFLRVNGEIAADLLKLLLVLGTAPLNRKDAAFNIGALQISMALSKTSELL